MDREQVTIRPIPKMGRNAVDTNELFIDDLFVADEDVVGEVGKGFKAILAGLNAERVISANAALGIGEAALRRGTQLRQGAGGLRPADRPEPGDRVPAGRGARSGSRRPTPCCRRRPGWSTRACPAAPRPTTPSGSCAEAGFYAADVALQVHGGFGYGKEFHVERYFREARLMRIAPISQEMVLNYVAEHVLGLPRSY